MTRVIWGTNIVIQETMDAFDNFLHNFKLKYRKAFDKKNGLKSRPLTNAEEGETLTYVHYLRLLRLTGQTNLNLDTDNLRAFPSTKKLYFQLCNYPQEVIPVMDQVLKDCMLKVAEMDQDEGVAEMRGDLGDAELRQIGANLYKVRPFGAEKMVNMRELNPNGQSRTSDQFGTGVREKWVTDVPFLSPCRACLRSRLQTPISWCASRVSSSERRPSSPT